MRISKKVVIILAIVLGVVCGLLWLKFGDHFIEPIFGQFITWYILPEIISLVFSLVLFFLDYKHIIRIRIANSLLFILLFCIFFWVPLASLILLLCLTGSTL